MSDDPFQNEIHRLRADYQQKRDTTNLVPPGGRLPADIAGDVEDGVLWYTYWYETGDRGNENKDSEDDDKDEDNESKDKDHQAIRMADIPGTLSGDILRLHRTIPDEVCRDDAYDYELRGNEVRRLEDRIALPPLHEDDTEDVSKVMEAMSLPQIDIQGKEDQYFCKRGKYVSEIRHLLACQGGSCPGTPASSHVLQLLGRSVDGQLVFPRLEPRYVLAFVQPLSTYKAWLLQLFDGLRCLHQRDIVHRDLRIDNLVFDHSHKPPKLVICDLEGRWGNRAAPEVSYKGTPENSGWSTRSDIFDVGKMIKGMVYGNTPITGLVEWPVPAPLDAIVAACTRAVPEERPTLDELQAMVDRW